MPPSSDTSPKVPDPPETQPEYTPEERASLLELAHDAILAALENREGRPFTASEHLSELRGAFTTLYSNSQLRGCVGYPTALMPLYRTVIETAQAAAFDDPRFVPVTLSEAPKLRISISVLSSVKPVRADDIVIGRHGLIISQGSYRGLLLPQVPVEHGWDRITFLDQTCRKAGLPTDAWRSGAGIEAFTAEVFGDPGAPAQGKQVRGADAE
jgi:AmmeMemoRadiSam system protein A